MNLFLSQINGKLMYNPIKVFKKTGDCLIGVKNYFDIKNKNSLAYFISQIPDTRRKQGLRYSLIAILCLVIWGYMSSIGSIRRIASRAKAYAKENPEILAILGIESIPCHTTISRILNLIDPVELNRAFLNWMNANQNQLGFHLAIDGKANCALTDKAHGKKHPPYIINVVETTTMQLIHQFPIPNKRSEISVVPEVIRFLKDNYPDLIKGMTITTDALSTQAKTMQACREANVAFISPIKNNQSELLAQVRRQIEKQLQKPNDLEYLITQSTEHGRKEKRIYTVFPVEIVDDRFDDIECVCQVVRYRKDHNGSDKHSVEKVFYQSTAMIDVNEFATFIENHWYVEVYHNYLDTKIKEDKSTSKGNAFSNCSLLRKASLNMIMALLMNQNIQTYNNISDNFLFNFESVMDVIFGV